MPDQSDILIRVRAQCSEAVRDIQNLKDNITSAASSGSASTSRLGGAFTTLGGRIEGAGQRIKARLGTDTAVALAAAGAAATSFAHQCVSSAIHAEAEWARFGGLVNSSGGNWDSQKTQIKSWATTFSNSMGYTVADTRSAAAALLQYGVSYQQLGSSMRGVAALAARTGTSQEEASQIIISALNGRAQALRRATGLEIANYKAADGSIDTQRLLADIYNQNSSALERHASTTEGALARLSNSWNSFKTSVGNALLPVVNILADFAAMVAGGFAALPGPVQTVVATFLALAAVVTTVLGVLGLVAGPLITIGGLLTSFGASITAAGGLTTILSTSLAGLATSLAGVIVALAPVIVAVAALTAAFAVLYTVGLKLGWWTSLQGMIQAFGARLSEARAAVTGFVATASGSFTRFVGIVTSTMNSARARAVAGALAIANGIRARLSTLPGLVRGIFNRVTSAISGALGAARSRALSLSSSIVGGMRGILARIPGIVSAEFRSIPGRISSVLGSAVAAARRLASSIVASFQGAMGIHSPGYIQRMTAEELSGTARVIPRAIPQAESSMRLYGESLIDAYKTGGAHMNSNIQNNQYNTQRQTYNQHKQDVHIDHVTLDCSNLSTSEARTLFYKACEGL